jgi:hypothetical protein
MTSADSVSVFPTPLSAYPTVAAEGGLVATLSARVAHEPFNLVVTVIFLLAILHTFAAARFMALAHAVQHRHDDRSRARGLPSRPSFRAEMLHFLGEVEVVFGLWAVVLLASIAVHFGWDTATHYANDTVNYTEPLFVVVIMALASTRPIISVSEAALSRVAGLGGATPAAWWLTILTIAPILGSFITEPAAMTICRAAARAAVLRAAAEHRRLRYATLGLLFANVSIGGTLHALRRAAGADGRAGTGTGRMPFMARATSAGKRRGRHRASRTASTSCDVPPASWQALADHVPPSPPVDDVDAPRPTDRWPPRWRRFRAG